MASYSERAKHVFGSMFKALGLGNILHGNEILYDRFMETKYGVFLRNLSPSEKFKVAQAMHLAYGLFDGLTPDDAVFWKVLKDILRDVSPEIASRLNTPPLNTEQQKSYEQASTHRSKTSREAASLRATFEGFNAKIDRFGQRMRAKTAEMRRAS